MRRVIPYFITFLVLQSILRGILLSMDWISFDKSLSSLGGAFTLGIVNDAIAFCFIMAVAFVLLAFGKIFERRAQALKIYNSCIFAAFCYFVLFISVSEVLFWEEFSARFNFIAVDYLVYTHEVLHNILESYPVFPLLAAIAMATGIMSFFYFRKSPVSVHFSLPTFAILAALSIAVSFVSLPTSGHFANRYNNELAKNGLSSLFSAYFQNELSYTDFYYSRPKQEVMTKLQSLLLPQAFGDGASRRIEGQPKENPLNIMLVVVESLSADYLGEFGNTEGLTPNLDRLAGESLMFTNLLATGTRTVYGLSAVTLSAPPLPGNSIVRRPNNEGLFNISSVLNQKGYASKFIYGGYGYFDNMNYFYANNGFGVIDRSNFASNEISFANAWGVCDEDLFDKALSESDKEYAQGRKFFNLVMTTSNHRPFTYPENKIDIKSKTGRKGGVKYTDYAIGKLIEKAKERPWFDDTVFVIIADHTAGSAGKSDVVPSKYHIPLIVYAPKHIVAAKVEKLASQIDLAPTLFGILGFSYDSKFIGHNILDPRSKPRAFISNYQQVGYVAEESLVVLKPNKVIQSEGVNDLSLRDRLLDEAVGYFQGTSYWQELLKQ